MDSAHIIDAIISSDDQNMIVHFDAVPYFAHASDEKIEALHEIGYGGDYAADDVAYYLRRTSSGIAGVLNYVENHPTRERNEAVGFEVNVDAQDVMRWLQRNRPKLFGELDWETVNVFREFYLDSRGIEMEWMTFAEALEVVHGIAYQALAVSDQYWERKDAALDTLEEFMVGHEQELYGLKPSIGARVWDENTLRGNVPEALREPTVVANAIRIALKLAEDALSAPETMAHDIEDPDEVARQQQALDVTRDLLGMHANYLTKVRCEVSCLPKP